MTLTFGDFLAIAFVWLEILAVVLNAMIDRETGIDHVEEKPVQASRNARTIPVEFYGESILSHLPKLEK